jgi:hypothetical protein
MRIKFDQLVGYLKFELFELNPIGSQKPETLNTLPK